MPRLIAYHKLMKFPNKFHYTSLIMVLTSTTFCILLFLFNSVQKAWLFFAWEKTTDEFLRFAKPKALQVKIVKDANELLLVDRKFIFANFLDLQKLFGQALIEQLITTYIHENEKVNNSSRWKINETKVFTAIMDESCIWHLLWRQIFYGDWTEWKIFVDGNV